MKHKRQHFKESFGNGIVWQHSAMERFGNSVIQQGCEGRLVLKFNLVEFHFH